MQSKAPLTLILSPLRAGRGEQERTSFGSLFGEPAAVPPKVPLSLCERERVRVGGMDAAKAYSIVRRFRKRLAVVHSRSPAPPANCLTEGAGWRRARSGRCAA